MASRKPSLYQDPICGIDEVGRGPWAGPVMAAAVILPARLPRFFKNVTDSKKLTPQRREALFIPLMESCLVGIGSADVAEIDSLNILQATLLAMQRAVAALPVQPATALVDGNRAPALPCITHTLVGGDLSQPAIAAASIIAKVLRDRLMTRLCDEHPGYHWRQNMGYGTKEHQAGLARYGVTPHHRRSFAPIRALLGGLQDAA